MISFGPIFQLQLYGLLCPCFQKSEDANARQAVLAINNACQRIHWIREQESSSSSSTTTTGSPNSSTSSPLNGSSFFGSILAKASSTVVVLASGRSTKNKKNCIARLRIQDNEKSSSQPELYVEQIPDDPVDDDDDDNNSSSSHSSSGGHNRSQSPSSSPLKQQQQQQSTNTTKIHIKLRRIDKVTLNEATGQIVLFSKTETRDGIKYPAREVLRFVVLASNTSTTDRSSAVGSSSATHSIITPATHEQRNTVVHHLMVLSEWERQRRAAFKAVDTYDDDDDDDDDNDGTPNSNFLTRQAQKATHFARREIELQQTKRDREKRKSKLLQEAGGLKYTALAMANRTTSNGSTIT